MRRGNSRALGGDLALQPRDPRAQRLGVTMHPVGAVGRLAG